MGRPRKQLPNPSWTGDYSARIASTLESARIQRGFTRLQDLADAAELHVGTVRRVLNAESVPDFDVIEAIAKACALRVNEVRHLRGLWCSARSARRPGWYRPRGVGGYGFRTPLRPELIGTFAELRQGIQWLLFGAGSPSTRELEAKAGLNVLPHSTLERTLQGQRVPSKAELVELVKALDHTPEEVQLWAEAWEQCNDASRYRRLRQDARIMAHAIEALADWEPTLRNSYAASTALEVIKREGEIPKSGRYGLRKIS